MNRVLNAVRLDFLSNKFTLSFSVIVYIAATGIGIIAKYPVITIGLIMVFGSVLSGMVFGVLERNRCFKLYGILPLKKGEVVLGKFLYALIIGAVDIVVAAILGFGINSYLGLGLAPIMLWGPLAIVFVYYCLTVSIAYPVYIRFTFAKAYVVTNLPMYLIFLALMLILRGDRAVDFMNAVNDTIQFFANNLALAPILGALVGLALLALAGFISNRLYKQKEL